MLHRIKKIMCIMMCTVLVVMATPVSILSVVRAKAAATPAGELESDWVIDANNNIAVNVYINDALDLALFSLELQYPDSLLTVSEDGCLLGKEAEKLRDLSPDNNTLFSHAFNSSVNGSIEVAACFTGLLTADMFTDFPEYSCTRFHAFTILFTVTDPETFTRADVTISADFQLVFDMSGESDVYMSDSISRQGCSHQWNDGEITLAADCEKDGVKTLTCLTCGVKGNRSVPATGHNWDSGTDFEDGILYTCLNDNTHTATQAELLAVKGDVNGDGKIDPADARLALRFAVNLAIPDDVQKIAADIDKDDTVSVADARRILRAAVNLDDLSSTYESVHYHSYKTDKKEATCTQDGYKKVYCEDCGYVVSDRTVAAKGHSGYVTRVIKEPTCSIDGKAEYTCSLCNAVYIDFIDAKHNYVNYYCHNCDRFEYRKFSVFLRDYLHKNGEYEDGIYYLTIDNSSEYDVNLLAGEESDPVLIVYAADYGELAEATAVSLIDKINGHGFAVDSIIGDSDNESIYSYVLIVPDENGGLGYFYEGAAEFESTAVENALATFEICFAELHAFMKQKGYTINKYDDLGLPK